MQYSIGEVARFSGVSQRMLRHYDDIGLLIPSDRTIAGYRQYSDDDLLRLQRILSLRATGLGLEEIAHAIDGDSADVIEQLRAQERVLRASIERLEGQLAMVDRTRRAREAGINLSSSEMFEVFGEHDPTEHAEEAHERWGETDAYKESHRRTSSYSKEQWIEAGAESERAVQAFIDAMQAGLPPESDEAKAAAELHRLQIDRWFYPCSHEMQAGLAAMYVADERFRRHYDDRVEGLARYVHDAITANALDHL